MLPRLRLRLTSVMEQKIGVPVAASQAPTPPPSRPAHRMPGPMSP